MLYDLTQHDVIAGHQAYIHRLMGPRIFHLAKTTHGSRDAPALRDYKLARSRPSPAHFARIIYLFIFLIEAKT